MNSGNKQKFDVVIFGNYTKDTIKTRFDTKHVDGGGFNYGAHALRVLGLRVAAVTRLARKDSHIVDKLQKIGVHVFPHYTSQSTHMLLDYPSDNTGPRLYTDDVVKQPLAYKDGYLLVPSGVGLGVEVDEALLEEKADAMSWTFGADLAGLLDRTPSSPAPADE